ncbi:MAG: 6-carboxytetrahydropterin synthase QueD [Candidatus Omnitrophica bacterium]|nr:6-carboxytetrahydropterin synthase QueD [Candidatus Omnitrophota bacterium]
MYAIKVRSYFSAAHNLRGYRGRCEKLHGHNWKVEAEVVSRQLNNLSIACDFKDLKKKLQKVLNGLDHTCLNKLKPFKKNNPTSEKIAEFIYYNLKKSVKAKGLILRKVSVWETESSQASFSEEET